MSEFFKAMKDFFTGKNDYGTGGISVKKKETENNKSSKSTDSSSKKSSSSSSGSSNKSSSGSKSSTKSNKKSSTSKNSSSKSTEKSTKEATKYIETVAVKLKSTLKETMGLLGGNAALRDDVSKIIPRGTAGGIFKTDTKTVAAFNAALKTIQHQKDMDIINEGEYYAALESLRDNYLKRGSDKWIEYTAKIYKYQKELLLEEKKRYEETYDDIFEYASDKIEAIIKKQADYEEKLMSYGRVFQKNTIRLDDGDIEFYSLGNLKSDNDQLERYTLLMREAKTFIKETGLSEEAKKELLTDISELPTVSAITALETLMKNNSSKDWLLEYERRVQLSKTESELYYKDDMAEALDETGEYMKEKLTEAGFSIPESFFDAGKVSAERFGEGFSVELNNEFERIKALIAQFSSDIGVSIMQESSGDNVKSGDEINTTNYYITADSLKEDVATVIKRYETLKRLGGY